MSLDRGRELRRLEDAGLDRCAGDPASIRAPSAGLMWLTKLENGGGPHLT